MGAAFPFAIESEDSTMPVMTAAAQKIQLAKLLLIGDGKIGKTYLAGMAAKDKLNVLYLDGDVGSQTLAGLPMEAREHIYLMDFGDRLDQGAMSPMFQENFTSFTTTNRFLWDDTKSELVTRRSDLTASSVWEIRPAMLDHTWVLVIDSWTSLTHSALLWASRKHNVDLANTDTAAMRPVYQAAGNKLTTYLTMIQKGLRCHVIVIAHPDEYSKYEKQVGLKVKDAKESDQKLLWTKLVPKSSSKPHSLTMAKYFTDVAWMEASRDGSQRFLNYKISDERISGGHFQDRKPVEEYSFAALIRQVGGVLPNDWAPIGPVVDESGVAQILPFSIHPVGSYQIATGAAPAGEGKVLNQTAEKDTAQPLVSAPVKKGFAALIAKKGGQNGNVAAS